MKIVLLQYSPVWENKEANKEKIISLLINIPQSDLIVFPEMTLTGFTMESSLFAEDLKGETFNFYSSLAKEKNVNILGGLIEKNNNNFFNSLLHISPNGELISVYRKIHPFTFSGEDKNYSGGNERIITTINKIKFGLSICYDLRFPELYRFYGKEKVEVIVDIANWPVARIEHWRTLLKARAIENQCFVIGVNRTGSDPNLKYNGFSSIYDPMGNEIISVTDEEKIIISYIDISLVEKTRTSLPFLNDIKLI